MGSRFRRPASPGLAEAFRAACATAEDLGLSLRQLAIMIDTTHATLARYCEGQFGFPELAEAKLKLLQEAMRREHRRRVAVFDIFERQNGGPTSPDSSEPPPMKRGRPRKETPHAE